MNQDGCYGRRLSALSTAMPPLVLKIGGSLFKSGEVAALLPVIARATRSLVVVPGGGAYADDVRAEQKTLGYADAEAHKRAILAMHRTAADFGRADARFELADSLEQMEAAWRQNLKPVWQPWPMVSGDDTLAQDWTTTSDTLAAWLSGKLNAEALVLIKSCAVDAHATLETLAEQGIVDPAFPAHVAAAKVPVHVIGSNRRAELESLLNLA